MCIQAFVWNNIRCFCYLCTCNVLNIFQNEYYGFLQICTYNLSKKQNYKEIYFMNDYFYDYKKVIFEVLWIIFEKLIRFEYEDVGKRENELSSCEKDFHAYT